MRYALPVVLAMMMAVIGCTETNDRNSVDAALQDNPFFKALGAIPESEDEYTKGGGAVADGDTTWPIGAWRTIHDPEVNYEITVQHPYATVDFNLDWPCTLYVVYTDLPDTTIRRTVVKPAPELHGHLAFRLEFVGDDWVLTDITPVDAEFDSAIGVISIDSVQVTVHRGGEVIEYPALDNTGLMPLDPYAYTFEAGDSINLRLWETHAPGVQFPWAYLHGPPEHEYGPFQFDENNGSWYGTWTVGHVAAGDDENWAWFEVIDLYDAIINPDGPDRAVLWGVPFSVE